MVLFVTVLIPPEKNAVNILVTPLIAKIVTNKRFSSQSRSAEKQAAKKNKIGTQDPFTCASTQSQEQGILMHTRRLSSGTIL